MAGLTVSVTQQTASGSFTVDPKRCHLDGLPFGLEDLDSKTGCM